MSPLDTIELETHPNPQTAVIWLHGLGASGDDFVPLVPELKLPVAVRFIFPHAPHRSVTINSGMVMPAWYDILSADIDRVIDTRQILQSAAAIGELIEQQIERGIASENIIIAGFSQGGAVAYETALSYPKPLGGLIALSTYFATKTSINRHKANQNLAIFIGHGTEDNVVSETLGQQAQHTLNSLGYSPVYHRYPIAHSVCIEEVTDIALWLQQQIK